MLELSSLISSILNQHQAVPEEWSQGRTTYGGALAALAMQASRALVPAERFARIFFVQFLGPIPPGERFDIETQILSSGKSICVVQVMLSIKGQPRFVQLTTYAAPRLSVAKLIPASVPAWPAPESLPELPFLPGITPNFTQAFSYRWAEGPLPFSGNAEACFGGYFCFKADPGMKETALAAMLDAWPPAALTLLPAPAPASSVSWSAHFLEIPSVNAQEWWGYQARTVAAGNGMATTQAHLYHPNGQLIAYSEQLVGVYG